jgi:WhiB family redox-sensing transcriptional regulator
MTRHASVLQQRSVWWEKARCRGLPTSVFFGVDERMSKEEIVEAKKLCGECPVRRECLWDAMQRDEPSGVWGGLTRREREALRGNLSKAAATAARSGGSGAISGR